MKPAWMDFMIKTVSELGRNYIKKPVNKHTVNSITGLCHTLLTRMGEATGIALAKDIVDAFNQMPKPEKVNLLETITTEFNPASDEIATAAQRFLETRDFESIQNLSKALGSRRTDLIQMLNFAPGGIEVIIQMRELVLEDLKLRKTLLPLEVDLFFLLTAWFNRGFLEFQQINWNTPAVILEQIIDHEAVHEIKSWKDLRRRLAEDRSCFAFFHPALHHKPLIFVQVAYTKGIAQKVQPILLQDMSNPGPNSADTAMFYSISNTQTGLKGISFGSFLIKQVVDHISKEMPHIKTFSTLSPIPKFRSWLESDYIKRSDTIFTGEEWILLLKPDWCFSKSVRKQLQNKLLEICAHYLVNEKKGIHPYDPVTRFHLGNGAKIENINWEADISENGLKQSAGLMVNYKYTPAKIVANHEDYINNGTIHHSVKVKKILG